MAIVKIDKNPIATNNIVFSETDEFTKDMADLNNKYNTVYKDLETFKLALTAALPDNLPGIIRISDLGDGIKCPVYKVKKFRCQALKGKGNRSGIRLIYTYYPSLEMIYFIEAYHKNKKDNEDRRRIQKYLSE
ncbi:MAG: hypothetical protein METHAR1v1_1400002 [Methanothrix sp.]|jgi:mRNA-degrading endonuclease RelE of RelBE toxin-antitoxin system|nr:MAG: hypothetical protein METHAR1v1_1400002 [Methanothrix sp.]